MQPDFRSQIARLRGRGSIEKALQEGADTETARAVERFARGVASSLQLASGELTVSQYEHLLDLAEDTISVITKFSDQSDDVRLMWLEQSVAKATIFIRGARGNEGSSFGFANQRTLEACDRLDVAIGETELILGVKRHLELAIAAAKQESEAAAAAAQSALTAMSLAQAAASDSATTALEHSFDSTAKKESAYASRWRWATISTIIATVVVGALFLLETAQTSVSWQGALYRLAIISALGAGSAYLARQSSHHRRISTWARSIQIQLKAFRGFVEQIKDAKVQDGMYELFARRILAPPPDSGKPDEVTNLVQPLLDQVIRRAP